MVAIGTSTRGVASKANAPQYLPKEGVVTEAEEGSLVSHKSVEQCLPMYQCVRIAVVPPVGIEHTVQFQPAPRPRSE